MVRSVTGLLLAACVLVSLARAENEGLPKLDQALEARLLATHQRDVTKVVDLCREALKMGLEETHARFAKSLLAASLLERASLAAETTFAKGPGDPLWPNYRSLALKDLEEAVTHCPELPDALLLIARLNLLADGDRNRAAEAIGAALKIEGLDPPDRASLLLMGAEIEEDNAKKLEMLDKAVRLAPEAAEPLRARAAVHAAMGKEESAAADFAKAIALDPDDLDTHENQARFLAEMGQFDRALVSLDRARALAPRSVVPLTMRAQVHVQMGNLDAALHDLNQALVLQPDHPIVLLLRATLYHETRKPDAALADLNRVLRREPDFAQARRLRWIILIGEDKLDQVVEEMEAQLKKTPDDQTILIQMAMLCTARREPQKAIDIYTSILTKTPDNAEALEGRANAMLGIGKHAEAIADFEKALKLAEPDSGTLNNLAWVLATSPDDELRDGRRAVELALKACELTQYGQAHILSTLAAAYAESGDFKSAVEWSKKAIELDKKDEEKGDDGDNVGDALEKELQSYRDGKPWRERLSEGLEAGPERQTNRP
ncbi:MAG: tetratricopeptide repeat protein [Pirellulaceae bacterium]|nr:tetratricopeptide repeat protein [Pirellulaceae bacterium]